MASTLNLIRDWATQLEYWEQAALEKIASGTPLDETDYQELLDLCMQDAGLVAVPAGCRPALVFPTKLVDKSTGLGLVVERIFNLENVNALPLGQEISFGPQLTVVYGGNASGKTSYARTFGCAAFARGEREVLTDARKPSPKTLPKARIEVSIKGGKKILTWSYGARCPELSSVYVFDTASINAHLTKANPLSFSPAGLSLLTQLAEVTDGVRERLRKLIELKSAPHNFAPFFRGDSWISRDIVNLSSSSNIGKLEKAAMISSEDEARILQLDQKIAELKAHNLPKTIATLRQEAKDLEELIQQVESTTINVGEAGIQVEGLVGNVALLREEAERVGAAQFKFEEFTQIGTDVWREFIGAAKKLAEAERHPTGAYPQAGDRCLFCRQTLPLGSIDLINRMWTFLSSDAPARFDAAQRSSEDRAEKLRTAVPNFFSADSAARRILNHEAPSTVVSIDEFIRTCAARLSDLQAMLIAGLTKNLVPLTAPDLAPLRAGIARRLKEIADLEGARPEIELSQLSQELCELQHRGVLSERIGEIKTWVDAQQWAARARKCIGSTHHITAKYNELFKILVTDQYRKVFEATLLKLKRNLKLAVETKGQKGETVRQIVLNPEAFAQKLPVEKVLSDGEKRSVALADFFTEISLDSSSSAMILDDPASSFDSDSREAVAQVLVEQAANRQVIVFTHDLAFVHALRVAAKKLSIGVKSHWIRSEDGQPGYVYLENSPICEGDYKSAKIARDCYTKAKAANPAERERLLQQGFGALRTSYEAFVIYDLFNEVVKRFEERVSFDRLRDVVLDRDIVEQVVEKLGQLSRYIDAHLHSDSFAADKPTPEMLLQEILAFEDLRKQHKEKRKVTSVASMKPVATVSPSSKPVSDSVEPSTASRIN